MTVTIDRAGRIVIPKEIREREGLEAGTALEITARDGKIQLELVFAPIRLERRGELLVAIADENAPALSNATVNRIVQQERDRHLDPGLRNQLGYADVEDVPAP